MSSPTERSLAVSVLEEALESTQTDIKNWVNHLRHQSSNSKIKTLIRKRLNAVAPVLGWGSAAWPEIPKTHHIQFIVDALDGSLLESPEVREILVQWLVHTRPESALIPLKKVIGIISSELNTIDHPTKTNLSVDAEYFCIKTVENE